MLLKLAGGCTAALVLGVLILGVAGPVVAEPTKVVKFRGAILFVYEEATGAPAKRIPTPNLDEPIDIIGPSSNGRYKVVIDAKEWWILKKQTETNEEVAGPPVICQSITTSYASSRAFSDCEEKK